MTPTRPPDPPGRRRPGTHRPGATGPTLLIGLIAVALVVTGLLAYQAHAAAASHRQVARQAVSDLASAAAWQFAERGSTRILEVVRETLARPIFESPDASDGLPPLARVARSPEEWDGCGCVSLERPATFFMLENGELEVEGAPLDGAARDRLADTLQAIATAYRPPQGEPLGHPGGGVLVDARGEEALAHLYYVYADPRYPTAVYGWAAGADEFVEAVFAPVLRRSELLPESLTGGLPADSLFGLEVRAPGGRVIMASEGPGGNGEIVQGGDRFPGWAGDLEVNVLVPEDRAEALVIGGLPASRLPLILLLAVVAGGLLTAAVLLLRQVYRLARLRSDFVAGVTHELRTPLSQIRMFTELLTLGKLDADEERTRALEVIDEESGRLEHLIDNVLGFARIGVAARPPTSRPVELDVLLEEVVERFRPLGRERRVSVELRVEPGLRALADRDAVHRIVLNLLDNAVKYGPRGQIVNVGAASSGEWARIEVEDQGPGVPAGDRRRIWEPYERLAPAEATSASGSGIGLAVVKGLVEGHRGRVFVEEGPGKGARFVVLLLLASADSAGTTADRAERRPVPLERPTANGTGRAADPRGTTGPPPTWQEA